MTRASDKPLRRVVVAEDGFAGDREFVVEITARTLTIRPVRTRRGGPVEVVALWGAIHTRGMMAKDEAARRAKGKRRRVTRGAL